MSRYKIGAVSYLNTKPLTGGMELGGVAAESSDLDGLDFDLVYDYPSSLAVRLASGELDVALVPSIVLSTPNPKTGKPYQIVSDACIGCHGPVWSVKLLSRVPLDQINTLALDEGSRTSKILVQILLARQFNVRPQLESLDMTATWQEASTDAVMIIGDRAMNAADEQFPVQLDLGEAWNEMTDHPFIFAVWAARPDIPAEDLDRLAWLMTASRDHGMKHVHEIAEENSDAYGLTGPECLRYLDHYLHYELGARERAGMELYFQYASELKLIPEPTKLCFHDCHTA